MRLNRRQTITYLASLPLIGGLFGAGKLYSKSAITPVFCMETWLDKRLICRSWFEDNKVDLEDAIYNTMKTQHYHQKWLGRAMIRISYKANIPDQVPSSGITTRDWGQTLAWILPNNINTLEKALTDAFHSVKGKIQ